MSQDLITLPLFPALMVAALGGLLSFLSPCVLPIVPPYLGYMAGITPAEMSAGRQRGRAVQAACMFVLGLSTVFLMLGMAASAFGRILLDWSGTLSVAAGLMIMVFGAHFVGVFRLSFLDRDLRPEGGQGGTAFGAYVLGLAFAFGWTPCIGPILGSILTIAAGQASLAKGTALLAVYALGLGLPFILAALFFPSLQPLMRAMNRHLGRIEKVIGLMLWTIGLMMLTGQFSDFSYWLLETFPVLATFG
jgi:cytochrome c-type biogenesis protein